MRPLLALCVFSFAAISVVRAEELLTPEGIPWRDLRGLVFVRQGDQSVLSLGGGLVPRKLKVTTATPEGPVVTRMTWPSDFHSPTSPPFPDCLPGELRITLPEPGGQLYFGEELIAGEGTVRTYQTPPLPLGSSRPLQVRGVYRVGNHLLIETQQVLVRPALTTAVTFTGRGALVVPVPTAKD